MSHIPVEVVEAEPRGRRLELEQGDLLRADHLAPDEERVDVRGGLGVLRRSRLVDGRLVAEVEVVGEHELHHGLHLNNNEIIMRVYKK